METRQRGNGLSVNVDTAAWILQITLEGIVPKGLVIEGVLFAECTLQTIQADFVL